MTLNVIKVLSVILSALIMLRVIRRFHSVCFQPYYRLTELENVSREESNTKYPRQIPYIAI